MFTQFDEEEYCYVLFESIKYHMKYRNGIHLGDSLIEYSNHGQRCKETTKLWELLVQSKSGSNYW